MQNMIVLPQLEKPLRLSHLMAEMLPDFEKTHSWSIKGQYTHPKYENDWVNAIRVEAKELSNAGHVFLQNIYRQQAVNRTVIVVHMCDLLKDDLEQGDEALDDFEQTVELLSDLLKAKYGWADVRASSQLSVNRDGFGIEHKPELPEMRNIISSGDGSVDA